MSYLKNWLSKITPQIAFVSIAILSALARITYAFIPTRPSWDGSVYLGMATYIAHGGHSGLWEYFRPILWPLILTPFSFGSPEFLTWSATIFLIMFSIIALYFVYRAGETVGKYVGVIAAFLLSASTPFFAFVHTPMTEVLSVFFVAAALWLFVEGKSFWLGIAIGLAFTSRFPLGLLLPIAGLALLVTEFPTTWETFKSLVIKGIFLGLGFAIPAALYFTSNIYFYGNAFSALSDASGMITGFLWLYQGDAFFYVSQLVLHNAWVVWSLVGIIFACIVFVRERNFRNQKSKAIIFSILSVLAFLVYFSLQTHKEFRYVIPVMPGLALLAAYGFVEMVSRGTYLKRATIALACITLVFSVSGMYFSLSEQAQVAPYQSFYEGLLGTHNATVISATPIIAPYSKVLLIPAYNTWENFGNTYEQERAHADYVAYDTCELHACTPGNEVLCKAQETSVRATIASREQTVFQKTVGACTLVIARITTSN
jgi:4-amino-4-deoxy-L-arabinose transferase-like glycosyltransferase